MQKLFQLASSAFVASMMVPTGPLKAATYTFEPTNVVNNPSNPSSLDYTSGTFPAVSISIQDSAIQSGSFSATYAGNPAIFGGDYASLLSFNIGQFISLTPSFGGASTFRANLLFDADGSVSAGALFYSSDRFEIDLAGSADLFQGNFVPSDTGYMGFVGGTLTAVPEPASLILVSGGVFCLGLVRRRAR